LSRRIHGRAPAALGKLQPLSLRLRPAVSPHNAPSGFLLHLSKKFVWGVSAAAPQIEGAAFVDGKGESVWDRYSRRKGAIQNGDILDVACDHYHRYRRTSPSCATWGSPSLTGSSLAWPRIFPEGQGRLNQKGLAFYQRLIDSMLEHGVTPG